MKSYKKTKEELFTILDEQIAFLKNDCLHFDAGELFYYKKIALTLRVLLHQTTLSTSLLNQLESAFIFNKPDFVDIGGYSAKDIHTNFTRSLLLAFLIDVIPDAKPVLSPCYIKLDNNQNFHRRAFNTWWDKEYVLLISDRAFLTRKDIITCITNMEGGAHVDPNSDERICLLNYNLANPLKMQIQINDTYIEYTSQSDQILPHIVRSIAEEVLHTFVGIYDYCQSHL